MSLIITQHGKLYADTRGVRMLANHADRAITVKKIDVHKNKIAATARIGHDNDKVEGESATSAQMVAYLFELMDTFINQFPHLSKRKDVFALRWLSSSLFDGTRNRNFNGYVVTRNKTYHFTDLSEFHDLERNGFFTKGSGEDLSAMFAGQGKKPEEIIPLVSKYDYFVGPTVDTFDSAELLRDPDADIPLGAISAFIPAVSTIHASIAQHGYKFSLVTDDRIIAAIFNFVPMCALLHFITTSKNGEYALSARKMRKLEEVFSENPNIENHITEVIESLLSDSLLSPEETAKVEEVEFLSYLFKKVSTALAALIKKG